MSEKRFALLIASFEYDDPYFRPLKAPAQDVKALSRVLGDPAIGDFGDVKTLLNEPKMYWFSRSRSSSLTVIETTFCSFTFPVTASRTKTGGCTMPRRIHDTNAWSPLPCRHTR